MSEPGQDLVVPTGPGLPDGLRIPAAELVEQFSRSPGPGGQSVNTSDTRVELRFDVSGSTAFTEDQLVVALDRLGPTVVVTASEHRSQLRNRMAARERLVEIVRTALAPPPPPRRPTRPTKGSQQRRLETKKQRGRTKAMRGRVTGER
ncbi:MAG: aminoacyl-tRNA hydrolase [Actinomycetota bacterium]|nr:aminoacyl-tRNA hydrolase [Actinomycetota bacterium]